MHYILKGPGDSIQIQSMSWRSHAYELDSLIMKYHQADRLKDLIARNVIKIGFIVEYDYQTGDTCMTIRIIHLLSGLHYQVSEPIPRVGRYTHMTVVESIGSFADMLDDVLFLMFMQIHELLMHVADDRYKPYQDIFYYRFNGGDAELPADNCDESEEKRALPRKFEDI